jgi:hypothetical protein
VERHLPGVWYSLLKVSPGPRHALPFYAAVSGMAHLQSRRPAAVFYPLGHPTTYTYGSNHGYSGYLFSYGPIMTSYREEGFVMTFRVCFVNIVASSETREFLKAWDKEYVFSEFIPDRFMGPKVNALTTA